MLRIHVLRSKRVEVINNIYKKSIQFNKSFYSSNCSISSHCVRIFNILYTTKNKFSFVVLTDGIHGFETRAFLKRLAKLLAKEQDKLYSKVRGFINARMNSTYPAPVTFSDKT